MKENILFPNGILGSPLGVSVCVSSLRLSLLSFHTSQPPWLALSIYLPAFTGTFPFGLLSPALLMQNRTHIVGEVGGKKARESRLLIF